MGDRQPDLRCLLALRMMGDTAGVELVETTITAGASACPWTTRRAETARVPCLYIRTASSGQGIESRTGVGFGAYFVWMRDGRSRTNSTEDYARQQQKQQQYTRREEKSEAEKKRENRNEGPERTAKSGSIISLIALYSLCDWALTTTSVSVKWRACRDALSERRTEQRSSLDKEPTRHAEQVFAVRPEGSTKGGDCLFLSASKKDEANEEEEKRTDRGGSNQSPRPTPRGGGDGNQHKNRNKNERGAKIRRSEP